jgi:hypothetical protein
MLLDRETKNSEKGKEETGETICNKKFRKKEKEETSVGGTPSKVLDI